MTGRPGHHTMDMNGKSTVSYLVRTPRVPFFMLILIGLEAKNLLAFQGRRGIASVVRWNLRPVILGVESPMFRGDHLNFFVRPTDRLSRHQLDPHQSNIFVHMCFLPFPHKGPGTAKLRVPKPILERDVLVRFFPPPSFSTPPFRKAKGT